MVHYNPDREAVVQTRPPLCPKCGSHRTEIIGMSNDQKMTFLRCAACGARSEVPVRDALAALVPAMPV